MPTAVKQTLDPKLLTSKGLDASNFKTPVKVGSLLGYLEQTGQIKTPGVQSVIKPVQEVMKPMSQELPVAPAPRSLPNGQPILASTGIPQRSETQSKGKLSIDDFAQKIKEKYPEYKDVENSLLATRILDKYPEYKDKVDTTGLATNDQRYDSNLFAGAADYYQNDVMGAIKASDNVLVNNPITRSLAGVGAMGFKGLRDVTQGGGELLDKGLAKVGLGDKKYKGSTVGENLYDIGQGTVNTLAAAYAPVAVTAIGAGMQSLPENAQKAVGEVMGDVGGFISKAPGLKQWRESLPVDRRKEFDNEVAGAAIGLLTGLKGKKNIIKDPKLFLKQNLNPVNIAKNFQENVLNLPTNAVGTAKAIPGQLIKAGDKINQSTKSARNTIAEGLISSELKNPDMRKQYISKVGQTPEKTILDAGIKGSLGEQLDQIVTKGQQSRKVVRDNLVKIPDTLKSNEGEWITSKIIEGADETMPGMSDILKPLKEMNQRFRDGTASAMDLNDAKTMLGRYEKIYDQFGRVAKTGDEFEKQALGKMYSKVRKEIEDLGEQYGMNLKDANRETMKREGLRGLYDSALSREAGRDMISLSDYVLGGITMAGDPILGVGLGIGKKVLKSPKVSSRIANALYSKTKNNVPTIGDTSTIDMNVASRVAEQKIGKGLPYKPTPATPVNPQGKVMINNPQSPITKKSQTIVIEKGVANKPGTTKVNPQAIVKKSEVVKSVDPSVETLKKLQSNTTLQKVQPFERIPSNVKGKGYTTQYGDIEKIEFDRGREVYEIGGKTYKASDVEIYKPKESPVAKKFTTEQELKIDSLKKYKEQGQRKRSYLQELLNGKSIDSLEPKQVDDFFELVNKRKRDDEAIKKIDTVKQGETPVKTVPKITDTKIEPKKATVDQELQNIAQKVKEKSIAKKENGSIMDGMKTTISDQIKEAKSSGKTFDEFISSKEKNGDILYHGTNSKFDEFDKSRIGAGAGSTYGKGVYMTDKKQTANYYKDMMSDGKGGYVMETYIDKSANIAKERQIHGDSKIMDILIDNNMDYSKVLQELGYDGMELNQGKGAKEIVIYNLDKLKTKSQLKAERDKLSPKSSQLDSMKTTISDQIKEAKSSGKTFDEFISSKEKNGDILYHGTNAKFDEFDINKKGSTQGFDESGIFFTDDIDRAKTYNADYIDKATYRMTIEEKAINNSLNVLKSSIDTDGFITMSDLTKMYEDGIIKTKPDFSKSFRPESFFDNNRQSIKEAVAKGVKGIKHRAEGETVYMVADPKNIKTEAQLKAERDKLSPKSDTINPKAKVKKFQ